MSFSPRVIKFEIEYINKSYMNTKPMNQLCVAVILGYWSTLIGIQI